MRELLTDLRGLGHARAPAGLLGGVLGELGLDDQYARLATPLGEVFVAWSREGVCAVMHASTPAAFEERYRVRFGRSVRRASGLPEGVGRRFDLRTLTEFERAVLFKALEIPRGEVRTYSWIAAAIGRPRAVRAVGTALRKNPVPVLIPCHRVVRSDGQVGEYALGGSGAKRQILAAEGVLVDEIPRLTRELRAATA